MRMFHYGFAAALLAVGACTSFAADEAPAPAVSLSPAMQATIKSLTSDDFSTREKALKALEAEIGEQITSILTPVSKETVQRSEALLVFEQGFARWINHVMSLAPADQQRILDFGFQVDHLQIMGQLYSTDVRQRVQGVQQLAKIPGADADRLLADCLAETERRVYIAALEAAWDRPPTPTLIEPVWTRAVGDLNAQMGMGYSTPAMALNFRGQPLQMIYDTTSYRRTEDGDVATEVLVHWNSPLVEKRIISYMDAIADRDRKNIALRGSISLTETNPQIKNLVAITRTYKPKAILPDLVEFFSAPVKQRISLNGGAVNGVRGPQWIMSNRTTPLILFIEMTGQKPEDFAKETKNNWGKWAFESAVTEEQVIKKQQDWWEANKANYGVDATQPAAASQPATAPNN